MPSLSNCRMKPSMEFHRSMEGDSPSETTITNHSSDEGQRTADRRSSRSVTAGHPVFLPPFAFVEEWSQR